MPLKAPYSPCKSCLRRTCSGCQHYIYPSVWNPAEDEAEQYKSRALKAECECARLKKLAGHLHYENMSLKLDAGRAEFFRKHYDACRRECLQLQEELAWRPPIYPKPSLWRRLKYLVWGK